MKVGAEALSLLWRIRVYGLRFRVAIRCSDFWRFAVVEGGGSRGDGCLVWIG